MALMGFRTLWGEEETVCQWKCRRHLRILSLMFLSWSGSMTAMTREPKQETAKHTLMITLTAPGSPARRPLSRTEAASRRRVKHAAQERADLWPRRRVCWLEGLGAEWRAGTHVWPQRTLKETVTNCFCHRKVAFTVWNKRVRVQT